MAIQINLNLKDSARPTIAAIADGLKNRRGLHAVLGKRTELELRDHFARREQSPNKRGWPKQHFWSRIRKATAFLSADDSGATVRVSDPALAQKIHGGTITPKEGKYLTLPAIAAAYGRSPRLNKSLRPMVRYQGGQRRAVALQDKKSGTVWYWLVKSVTQQADPHALPADATVRSALVEEAGDYLDRLTR